MYAVKNQGDFQDAERGMIRRTWASRDEDGHVLLYRTKSEAIAAGALADESRYDGIAGHNVLSHGQMSGYPPQLAWVSNDPTLRPVWAR